MGEVSSVIIPASKLHRSHPLNDFIVMVFTGDEFYQKAD